MQITLTTQEAQMLVGLLDTAIKSGGLQVAEPAIHFAKLIKNAVDVEAAAKPQDSSTI